MTNLNQIAEKLGLSKTTVSFVLNGRAEEKHISRATAERIRAYCREIGYLPNIHASRTSRRVVRNVMVLLQSHYKEGDCDPFADYNAARAVGGITQAASSAGYDFLLRSFDTLPDMNSVFDYFRCRAVDGMIFYGSNLPSEWRQTAIREKCMITGISIAPAPGIRSVNVDNAGAGRKIGEIIASRNCRNVLYIDGGASYVADERKKGFYDGIREKSRIINLQGDYTDRSGFELVTDFLSANAVPDAIVCANDKMLLGAITACRRAGADLTKIQLAGGDNIDALKYINENLLTFDYRPDQLGKCAMELILKMINGESCGDILLETDIISYKKTE